MKNKGITLVALVITIVILLILASISLNLIAGGNGILEKTSTAVEISALAAEKEQLQLALVAAQMDAITTGNLEIESQILSEIIEKYGELQDDGDTIVTENGNISLKEIYSKIENGEESSPDAGIGETVDKSEVAKLAMEIQNLKTEISQSTTEINNLKINLNTLKNTTKILDDIYPVGSIYISTNLATANEVIQKLGGNWESYASGKTLVEVGTSDQTFNVRQTGGESNHTLTVAEMASHSHNYSGTTTSTYVKYDIIKG